MQAATLGGLIKDYRIQKRLSQQDLAMRIGWNDTSRLSKIEQGRVSNPSREVLDKIFAALELNDREKTEMLLASNVVPTKKESDLVIRKIKTSFKQFEYPLILADFSWQIHFMNMPARRVLTISDKEYTFIEKNTPNWLVLLFLRKSFKDVEIKAGYTSDTLQDSYKYWIAHFKYEQATNTQEKWYRNLLTQLNKDDIFRSLWPVIQSADDDHIYGYEVNEMTGVWDGKKQTLTYNVYGIKPTYDFRFSLLVHQPQDLATMQFK